MKKLTVLLFSILISFSSYGEWTYVTKSTSDDRMYFDNDTIKEHNGYVYYWILNDLLKPDPTGVMSDKQYIQSDCGVSRNKVLRYIFYKQSMGKGEIAALNSDDWNYPSPGTMGKIMLDYACNYVK